MAVGIVVVSHSAKLAEAVAELAREMAGPELRLALAGGVDDPDAPLGTDAMRVLAAIEELDGDDGVLVLMDLGSAVLSAELALELLSEEQRARVVLCDAPLVEGLVAAAVQAAAGAPMDRVVREARDGLAGKSDHLGTGPTADSGATTDTDPGPDADSGAETGAAVTAEDDPSAPRAPDDEDLSPAVERRLTIANRLGLHARPAGRIVTLLAQHRAQVTLEDLSTGRGPVRADSLNAIITLGARGGHELAVRGRGPDAEAAVTALLELAATGFGDPPDADDGPRADSADDSADDSDDGARVVSGDGDRVRSSSGPGSEDRVPPVDQDTDSLTLQGRSAAPGLAAGHVHRLAAMQAIELPDRQVDDTSVEQQRLREALDAAADALRDSRAMVAENADESATDILDAQVLLLADPLLVEAAMDAIASDSLDAARAWQRTVDDVAASYRELEDAYLAERAGDVEAMGVEVLRHLLDLETFTAVPTGVVVAQDLSPAETARLDPGLVEAVVTAGGSPTGHAALIARSLGIPSVVGLGDRVLHLEEGATIVVDGDRGIVELAPDEARLLEVRHVVANLVAVREAARLAAQDPAHTADGTHIEVAANVGSAADARRAGEEGADGIGLLRSELLFLDRDGAPDEHEQVAAYEEICGELDGRPVVLRTLDVGGDKPLPYIRVPHEVNPFLGVRGLRLALAHPDTLLLPQLRAALRVAAVHPLRLMLPMVSTLDELGVVREWLDRARSALVAEGVAVADRLALGTMVEVPALALRAESLVAEVDFVSIGTNDLTQYALAAERGNPGVDHLADPLDPTVLRLIAMVCDAATPSGVPVAVCGGLASDPAAVAVLIGLGVRELSVPPGDVPTIKQQVRATDLAAAVTLARRALGARSAAEVRELAAP